MKDVHQCPPGKEYSTECKLNSTIVPFEVTESFLMATSVTFALTPGEFACSAEVHHSSFLKHHSAHPPLITFL